MKILMLTPYLPYPIWSGGQIRTYNLLKNLSREHEITLFSFIRDPSEKTYINKLKEYCVDVAVFKKRPPWSVSSLSLAALTFYPLVVCMYLNREVTKAIARETKKKKFDLIHAETFYVMPNIPDNTIPTILVEQTIEYLVYKHFTKTIKNPVQRLLMNWDVAKIKYWERQYWKRASRVVAMSDADKRVMQDNIAGLTVDLVPNGVDADFFMPKKIAEKKKRRTILFVGNFKWLQNREAVLILTEKIMPVIKKSFPDARLWIVGRSPTPDILQRQSDAVQVSSDIEDIRDTYRKSDLLLAPIYGPGGTRYKILESMASGLPVVTTPTGVEGLGVSDGKEALICKSPQDLAEASVRLLSDDVLYRRIAASGRLLVKQRFGWKGIASTLDRIYHEAADDQHS